jgi:D-aminopeptidase
MVPHSRMNPFFEATAEAVEEAILNALTAAETMTGFEDHVVYELPLDDLQAIMVDYRKFMANHYQ